MESFVNFLNLVISIGYVRAAVEAETHGRWIEAERMDRVAEDYRFAYVASQPWT